MSKATGLWNAAKEAYRAAKGLLSKNERNAATAQAKKERGPVKAMFHITKNENVPAIEQQGLVANNPNANVNSAYQPFRSVGVKGGGNWVTDRPTAFPVYGTTVGGKHGNEAARRDALTTFKIEFPVSKLPTTRAVRDPYGNAKLTTADKGWSLFDTWTGADVNTMAILEDIDPKYLKNIGYVEELNPKTSQTYFLPELVYDDISNSSKMSDLIKHMRANKARQRYESKGLNKADRNAMSYVTGHDKLGARAGNVDVAKSPARFVNEYIDKNQPITKRLPEFPRPETIESMARRQGASMGPKYVRDGITEVPAPNEAERYSTDFIPARKWTEDYRSYVKPGESVSGQRYFEFAPGAVSRGIGGVNMPSIKERNFNWNNYKKSLEQGATPQIAAFAAQPAVRLDWDNIVYHSGGYRPKTISSGMLGNFSEGAISRGMDLSNGALTRMNNWNRRKAVDEIQKALKSYNELNADIVRNEYKLDMPDDEIRELSRLEMRNNKDNKAFSDDVINWSRLENSDILKRRKQALDRIKGSWLWNYLTK